MVSHRSLPIPLITAIATLQAVPLLAPVAVVDARQFGSPDVNCSFATFAKRMQTIIMTMTKACAARHGH